MLSLLASSPLLFLAWIAAVMVALSVHEFSHALAGTWLGDDTAKRMGRLTLNPASHVDMLGLLALVTAGFGWGRPVPFNPYNLRNQRWGPVLIAFAGPTMNLLVALVFGLVLRLLMPQLGADNLLIQFLFLSVTLNLGLLLFNLIPIPPLDGSKLLLALLQGRQAERARIVLESYGPWILIGLVIANAVFDINVFSGLERIIEVFLRTVVGVT